jgi:hypothetical protein
MVSRITRSVPVTVNDVPHGHAVLDLDCLDRLYPCMVTWPGCRRPGQRKI